MSKSLYLYRYLDRSKIECKELLKGIIISDRWPIVGINISKYSGRKLREIEKEMILKEFEIQQKSFDEFIKFSENMNILLNEITFTEEISDDEKQELQEYIKQKRVNEILSFIDMQRDLYRDIERLKFTMKVVKVNRITVSSTGVINIDSNSEEETRELLSTDQIGLLLGANISSIEGV